MTKKIDKSTIETLKLLCYEAILGNIINEKALFTAKTIVQQYLDNKGYKIINVKCDWENNSPDIIDRNEVYIDITEEEFPGSQTVLMHRVIL